MPATRRCLLAAGLASLDYAHAAASAPHDAGNAPIDDPVAELTLRSERANAALMRGDIERYNELVTLAPDFTLMSPFGGTPSRGRDYTPERLQAMGRFFRNGVLAQDVVQTYGSKDMVVLAVIERAHVEVGGLAAQDWSLRVTLVYRRAGADWHLVHRHADPLVAGISLEQAAALARARQARQGRG